VQCGLRSTTEDFRDSSHLAFVHREAFGDSAPLIPNEGAPRNGGNLRRNSLSVNPDEWQAANAAQPEKCHFGGAITGEADPTIATAQLIAHAARSQAIEPLQLEGELRNVAPRREITRKSVRGS
jgi:hypothetical protein